MPGGHSPGPKKNDDHRITFISEFKTQNFAGSGNGGMLGDPHNREVHAKDKSKMLSVYGHI